MRQEGITDFEINWEAFDGQQKQYKQEAEYAKEAGKLEGLVCAVCSFALKRQYKRPVIINDGEWGRRY